MVGQGLNIEAIRELNKLRVIAVTNYGEVDSADYGVDGVVFSAYMKNSLSGLGAGVKAGSLTENVGKVIKSLDFVGDIVDVAKSTSIGKFIKDHEVLSNVIGQSTDYANKINYNYNYRFKDVDKFSTTFNCELVVKDDFFDDVLLPLWSILHYVLPDETRQFNETELWGSAEEKVEKFGGIVHDAFSNVMEQDALDWLWGKITTVVSEGADMLGGLSIYKKPPQLSDNISHTRILIGDRIVIDNVIITNVKFDLPYLYYEDGVFDKVDVTLTVEGNRQQSLKTYDWIKDLYYVRTSSAGFGGNTLNSIFED